MKRFVALAGVLVATFGLAGCGEDGQTVNGIPNPNLGYDETGENVRPLNELSTSELDDRFTRLVRQYTASNLVPTRTVDLPGGLRVGSPATLAGKELVDVFNRMLQLERVASPSDKAMLALIGTVEGNAYLDVHVTLNGESPSDVSWPSNIDIEGFLLATNEGLFIDPILVTGEQPRPQQETETVEAWQCLDPGECTETPITVNGHTIIWYQKTYYWWTNTLTVRFKRPSFGQDLKYIRVYANLTDGNQAYWNWNVLQSTSDEIQEASVAQ